jgi:hypothetical protein
VDWRTRKRKRKIPKIFFPAPAMGSFLPLFNQQLHPKDNEVTLHNVNSIHPHTLPSSRIMPQAIAEL